MKGFGISVWLNLKDYGKIETIGVLSLFHRMWIPEQIEEFIEDLKEKCNVVTADRRIEIEAGTLADIEGFIEDIDSNEEDIRGSNKRSALRG